jgi:predicted aspartyl protease
MVHGAFLADRDLPTIQVPVAFRETVLFPTFILDTGFSGYIKVDQQTADELGIEVQGVTHIDIANGERIPAGVSTGYAELENKKKPIDIIIAKGSPLAGMGLFTLFEYKVVVDCKNRTAHLESTI